MNFRALIFAVLIGSITLLISCDTTNEQTPDAPELPPPEAMQMDVNEFNSSGASKALSLDAGSNFNTAATYAMAYSLGLGATAGISSAMLQAATSASPKYEKGVFRWSYTHAVNQRSFEAVLTGQPGENGSAVDWVLRVSAQSENINIEDRILMSGQNQIPPERGTWRIYSVDSTTSEPVARLDWTYQDSANRSLDLEFAGNASGDIAAGGDMISYNYEDSVKTIRHEKGNSTEYREIHWNVNTSAGYMMDMDGEQYCWNSNRENTPCD